MATTAFEEMQGDQVVTSVAKALTLANEAAVLHGTDPAKSLISITEELTPGGPVWRINYVKRDFVNRRGGDLIVFVDGANHTVQRVLRGQ